MQRRTPARLTAVLAFALLGAILSLARWAIEPSHASGDAFWYARMAVELSGSTEAEATRAAAQFIVAEGRGDDPQVYVDLVETIDPRYPAIFESRPVYPLIVTPLVWITNLRLAMAIGALLAGVAFAVAFGWFVRNATRSLLVAFSAVIFAFALPLGTWFAFMYADGWMLALWTLVLTFACLYLEQARGRFLAAAMASLVVLYLTKPANGAALVIALGLLGVGAAVFRTQARRQAATLAASALLVGVSQLVVFAALGLPGINTTLQDLLTVHFTRPDVADPIGALLARDLNLFLLALDDLPVVVGTVLVIGVLSAPLVVSRRPWAVAWLLAGIASTLTVLVHPLPSEIPRLIAPLWVTAALGGALLFALVRNMHFRGSTQPGGAT